MRTSWALSGLNLVTSPRTETLLVHDVESSTLTVETSGFGIGDAAGRREREFLIATLLVRIHFGIVMIRWTGLAPWEIEFPFQAALHLSS